MLNPHNYVEDCIRHQQDGLWNAQFPWAAINDCIDNITMEYSPSSAAVENFTDATQMAWDSLDDNTKPVTTCPRCNQEIVCEWTSLSGCKKIDGNEYKEGGCGFADNRFKVQCQGCQFLVTHEVLRAQRFRKDVQRLLEDDVPMPGTVITSIGRTALPPNVLQHPREYLSLYPNRMITALLSTNLLEVTDPKTTRGGTLSDIRSVFEAALKDDKKLEAVKGTTISYKPLWSERVAIRKMMSRYWDNNCVFSLDLTSAAIRQGSFIEKMYAIDWIHSPAVHSTLDRLVTKYDRFFAIIALGNKQRAVPTLDVDLAW